jgi:hypothetical protein
MTLKNLFCDGVCSGILPLTVEFADIPVAYLHALRLFLVVLAKLRKLLRVIVVLPIQIQLIELDELFDVELRPQRG